MKRWFNTTRLLPARPEIVQIQIQRSDGIEYTEGYYAGNWYLKNGERLEDIVLSFRLLK